MLLAVARFEDVAASFWDEGDYGVQASLTPESVADAERELGLRLPSELLELLRLRNGGPVADAWSTFPISEATSWSSDHVPFESLFGIGRGAAGLTLLDSPYPVAECFAGRSGTSALPGRTPARRALHRQRPIHGRGDPRPRRQTKPWRCSCATCPPAAAR